MIHHKDTSQTEPPPNTTTDLHLRARLNLHPTPPRTSTSEPDWTSTQHHHGPPPQSMTGPPPNTIKDLHLRASLDLLLRARFDLHLTPPLTSTSEPD
ncbi:unnamed protein product [Gadus morhua 'NCC']